MLELHCRHCLETVLEADEAFEKIGLTGMCPNCSHFYDDAVEREADLFATRPEARAAARRVRLVSILLGLPIAVFSLLLLLARMVTGKIWFLPILGIFYGLGQIAYGLVYTARREARSQVARQVDVRKLARAQMQKPPHAAGS